MKSREQYVKPYKEELEQFVEHVADVCRDAGYKSIDDAYESIRNKPPLGEEITNRYNGYNSAEDYHIMSLIDGIYEYEKPFYKAHRRYDGIIEKLASKNKTAAEEFLKMKQRDERARALLEELNKHTTNGLSSSQEE